MKFLFCLLLVVVAVAVQSAQACNSEDCKISCQYADQSWARSDCDQNGNCKCEPKAWPEDNWEGNHPNQPCGYIPGCAETCGRINLRPTCINRLCACKA